MSTAPIVQKAECFTTRRHETTGTRACIGYNGECGKVAYVTCRYDGYLEHVGMLLAECYNDIDKVVELLCGGDIESLRDDLQHTTFEV